MSVQEIKSQLTGDKYYKVKHKSGLNIYVYEKEGYNSTYAVFGTRYGSINTTFSSNGGEKMTVPDVLLIILNINYLNVKTEMPLQSTQRQVQTLMHLPALIKLATFSQQQIILRKVWKFFWILYKDLILLKKQ